MTAPQSQIWETWSDLVKQQRGKPALHLRPSNEILTFGEVDELTRHWSEALRGQTLRMGDRVLVRCGNTPHFIALFLSCMRLRKIFVPLESKTTHEQTRILAERFAARALVTLRGVTPLAPATGEISQPPAGTAVLQITSGSTGEPRAAACSEASLIADCANLCGTMGIKSDDTSLAAISLAHRYGFGTLALALVTQGTAMTLLEEFVPRAAIDAIVKTRGAVFPGVPFMYECINDLSDPLPRWPSLRTCISAGAPLTPEIARKFHDRFGLKIHTLYGSSECGGISYDASDEMDEIGQHVGTPMHNVNVDLEPGSDLRDTTGPAEGRIRVRGDNVGLGYWPKPTKDDKAALGKGTFLTGDLGQFDEKGRIRIVGRIANFINVAGKKVNPAAVEDCIRQLESVKHVAVLGAPDESRGEQVVAFVLADAKLGAETVIAHCRKTLADYQIPRRVKFLKELPLSARGKLEKKKLLEMI